MFGCSVANDKSQPEVRTIMVVDFENMVFSYGFSPQNVCFCHTDKCVHCVKIMKNVCFQCTHLAPHRNQMVAPLAKE